MKKDDEKRRSFLKQILGTTAMVAGSALIGKKAQAGEGTAVKRPDEVLYKKTAAFKNYYDSLR